MKKIKVTVYITSKNYGRYLKQAIDSVLSQTIDNWELLLINDNSDDNTAEIMEIYKGDERIKIFSTTGIGLPATANLALKNASGDYLIRLDADDIFDENILLILSHYLDVNLETALIFPDYYLIDDQGGLIRHEKRNSIYNTNHMLDMPANGACTMIRMTILKNIGGYREDLGAQDGFDIWTKITKEYKCANVNLPLFYYRRHGDNLTDNTQRILNARRAIKHDAANEMIDKYRPIVAVIPCRKNYDVLPDLWSQKINDETLLDIAIKNNIASGIFDKIIITSDTDEVKSIIDKYHDERLHFIFRETKFTIPSCGLAETLELILKKLNIGWEGISVLSYIQAPFTNTKNIEEAVYTLIMNGADSSFAVEEINRELYRRSPYGLVEINHDNKFRTDFDIIYQDAQTSLATKNTNLKTGGLLGAKIANFIVPKNETFFIHDKRDVAIASYLKNYDK